MIKESFVLCQDYTPPEGYVPTMINPILGVNYGTTHINITDCNDNTIADATVLTFKL
jgi:hypothetical protein